MASILTVFGATGNLMYKKMIPALAALQAKRRLPEATRIVCVGRADHTDASYVATAKAQVAEPVDWDRFAPLLSYFRMEFDRTENYRRLREAIGDDATDERVFYLAVAPELFPVVAAGLADAGLVRKGDSHARVAFEKPFGEDLASAQAINRMLWECFDESQIYRVDHYLGKEMIQNLLVVRFANRLFESGWNNAAVERVTIVAKETEGVMNRGNYYDRVGALKDMVQSHLLQMAALVAMEAPERFDADGIRAAKVRVLKDFTFAPDALLTGQYVGYRQEKNVAADSTTETFVFLRGGFDNPRWKGVPFDFITGKRLDRKKSEIVIDFRPDPRRERFFPGQSILNDRITIDVTPNEGVTFRFNVKQNGLTDRIAPIDANYCHDCVAFGNRSEAYERLLLDIFQGVSTLFTRWDEIETAWRIIDGVKATARAPLPYAGMEDIARIVGERFGGDLR